MRSPRKRPESYSVSTRTLWGLLLTGWLLCACTHQVMPGVQPTASSFVQDIPTELSTTAQVFLPYSGNQVQASPEAATATQVPEPSPSLTPVPENKIRFAVIGDYGLAGQPELEVAALVASWQPDLILTTGDNNYPNGEASTIDANIGQYYSEYIFPYLGNYGPGGAQNRFFPTLGNHDFDTPGAGPYLDYFNLPGNERYYDFQVGPVHFFALNSDSREPDGVSRLSIQAGWLESTMSASTAPWQIVYFHAPPYSSGWHGSVDWMRWPFKEWGADAILAGHDHTYERLSIDGLVYFVNGLGGGPRYDFVDILASSQMRYNDEYGAMLVDATSTQIRFQFWNRTRQLIDEYQLVIQE